MDPVFGRSHMSIHYSIKKVITCFLAVFGMGFFLSFLILCDLGTDPCTFMNKSISAQIGLSFGTWQLCLNLAMLLCVFLWDKSVIGPGTVFNMVLIGYYADFFCWLWKKLYPETWFTEGYSRWIIFFITLAGFIISASIYINSGTGVSPYDALPTLMADRIGKRAPRIPPALVRICYDGSVILIGMLAKGRPNVGIVLMALFLGPVISVVNRLMNPKTATPAQEGR